MLLVPSLPDCVILGMNFWEKFGVKAVCCSLEDSLQFEEPQGATKPLTREQRTRLEKTIASYPKAERGKLGRTQLYEHRIDVGNAPAKKQRHYPMSHYVLQEVNKEIDRMLELDVIEEAKFSPWNNPLVAVKKKTGQYRVCLDARHLNSIMVNEGFPIPQIASIMNNLSGSFASANIPLYKLDHPKLRDYLSRNVKNLGVLPQSTTLRSQVLPKVFDVAQQELRERVAAASSIVIAADEASDQQDRFILHIVFILPVTSGQQDKMEAVTADLVFLDKVNATTVSRAIIQTLTKFDVDFDKVVVVLTDNATYMTKAVTSLKVLLPNCIHLTCNAHILSLVGETFRRNFPAVDRMIACFKSIFVHCSSRKLRYREFIGRECGSEVPLPPVPVVTRWNSWFRAVAHHAKYVEHYKKFIEAELLVSAPTSALLELNDLFKTDSVRVDVVFIMMNSTKLMDLLTWFENRQFGSKGEKEKNKIYKKAFQDAAAKLNQYYTETSARFTQPGLSFMKAVRGFDPAQAKILSLDGLSDGIPECAEKLPEIEGELAAYKQCALEIEDGQTRRSKRKQPEKASK
ncbi:hypothetical protein pipiens_018518 [Culex pipiens pipiens]|uniref:Transposase n=1 Tax=Culex pipiens pipiens TaxID=38569 RepID=A0ABD1CBF1_CULPP